MKMSALGCPTTWGVIKTIRSLISRKFLPINFVAPCRQYKRWTRAYLMDLYRRREEAGPEPERRRSDFSNWNYEAEIFAFGKRLGEEFGDTTLKIAFTDRSYRMEQEEKLKELGVTDIPAGHGVDNVELAEKGEKVISEFLKTYLRHAYPLMFEEGIIAIHNYLTSEQMLAHIGSHMGIKDLILCEEIVPKPSTLCQTFKAIVGALATDQGEERAQLFVRDFILPQLIGKDINEFYEIINPMGALTDILKIQNKEPPEPRLLWQSGSETIMSVYYVGIYCNKELIGKAPGETVTIAEEMAARDALKNIMKIQDYRAPFQYKSFPKNMDFNRVNWSLEEISVNELSDGVK